MHPDHHTDRARARRAGVALLLLAAVLAGLAGLGAGSAGAAEPSGSPEPAPTATPSPPAPSATPSPSDEPTPTPTASPTTAPPTTAPPTAPASAEAPTTGDPVSGVTLRWGLTNESSNRAFAPGTFNFFSAGRVADPGRGGVTLQEGGWRQAAGAVSVQKWNGTTWQPASWAGLGTDSAGVALGAPTAGTFSNHTFVFSGGTGTIDRASGEAHVSWQGDVTVLYYSGMSFFYLSDPVLDVVNGVGRLSGTLSGFASSQSDASLWQAVEPRRVTLADLPSVNLADVHGTVTVPAYRGVVVSGVPQSTSGADAGSFPQSWIDFANVLGTAAFWHSSGGSTDAFKVALPLTVGFDDAAPVARPTAAAPTRAATARNSARPLPTPKPTAAPSASRPAAATPPAAPAAQSAPAADVVPPGGAAPPTTDGLATVPRPATAVRPTAAPPALVDDPSWLWWLGGGLLLAAALLLLVPSGHRGRTPTP